MRYRRPKDPSANQRPRSLVHPLLTDNPESPQDTTSPSSEEAPETLPALANSRDVRQTLPDTRPSRPRTSTAHSQAEETLAGMVPPDHVAAWRRSRVLCLNNIQRSRRNRRPNNTQLYTRHESSLNDHSAGKSRLNHSLTHQSQQFCGKRQPELYSHARNHERHDRPEPRVRLSTNRVRIINTHSVRPSLSPTEHLHNNYRWG